ncbi:MAG: hypothetical protein BMS9Abin33_1122 [Gammaproteobacteria bacterium]|nr:MAG: hypothetical protein BMS9Abin33_1122 [Gammaproteobacteria bacterium]
MAWTAQETCELGKFGNPGEGIKAMVQAFAQAIADSGATTKTLSEKTDNIDDPEIKDHIIALEKILSQHETSKTPVKYDLPQRTRRSQRYFV